MDNTVSDLVQHGVEELFDGGGHGGGGVDGRGDGTQATDTQNRDGEGLTIDYGVGKPRASPTTRTSFLNSSLMDSTNSNFKCRAYRQTGCCNW